MITPALTLRDMVLNASESHWRLPSFQDKLIFHNDYVLRQSATTCTISEKSLIALYLKLE